MNEHRSTARMMSGEPPLSPAEQSISPETRESSTGDRRHIERISKKAIDTLEMQHGILEPTHEAVTYLQSFADRLPKIGDHPLHVDLLCNMTGVNALALPNGRVLVTSGLLQYARTEEEILGILAHEYVHIARQHGLSATPHIIIGELGQKRLHEHEADLRGTIEYLTQARVNPMGMRNILKRMGEEEKAKNKSGGLVHGSSLNRALALSGVTYMFELEHLDAEETPIDSRIQSSVANIRKQLPTSLYRTAIFDETQEPASLEADKVERINQAEKLSNTELVYAIGETEKLMSVLRQDERRSRAVEKKKQASYEAHEEVFNALIQELDNRWLPKLAEDETTEDEETTLIYNKIALYELIANLPVLSATKPSTHSNESSTPFSSHPTTKLGNTFGEHLNTLDDLDRLRRAVQRLSHIKDIPYLNRDIELFFDSVVSLAHTMGVFADEEKSRLFTDAWVDTLTPLAKEKNISSVCDESGLRKLVSQFRKKIEEKERREQYQQECKKVLEGFPATSDIETQTRAAKRIGNDFGKQHEDKPIAAFVHEYRRFCETFEDILVVSLADFDDFDTKISFEYVTLVIANTALEKNHAYQTLTKQAQAIIRYSIGQSMNLDGYILDQKEKALYDAHNSHLISEVVAAKKKEEVKKQHTYFKKYFNIGHCHLDRLDPDLIPLLYTQLKPLVDDTTNLASRFFVTTMSAALCDKPLREIVVHLRAYHTQGVPALRLAKQHHEASTPMVVVLAESIQRGEQVCSAEEFIDLLDLVKDYTQRKQLERFFKKIYWADLSFDEKLDLLFPNEAHAKISHRQIREEFIEREMVTKEHVAKVKKALLSHLERVPDHQADRAGVGVLMSQLFVLLNKDQLFAALLITQENEQALRDEIFEKILDQRIRMEEDEGEKSDSVLETIHDTERLIRTLYRLDDEERLALIQEMFIGGKDGLMLTEEGREYLLQTLLNLTVTKKGGQDSIGDVLQFSARALAQEPQWEPLFFGLLGPVRDHILHRPDKEHEGDWTQSRFYAKYIEDAIRSPKDLKKIKPWSQFPDKAKQDPERYRQAIVDYAATKIDQALDVHGFLQRDEKGPLSPIEFIKEVGGVGGALTVRFLQQIPLIAELSHEQEDAFSDVYDRMKGQSKINALLVLEREWPDVWNHIESVDERIGGGSIVTVYRAMGKDGKERVIKIRNPNITTHLNQNYTFIRNTLTRLAKEHKGGYVSAVSVMDSVKEWIEQDISFEDFLKQDRVFSERHHGTLVAGTRYRVHIPQSEAPENPFVSVEAYAPGKNLTQWSEMEKTGHNPKELVCALTRWYMQQIIEGQVLSDVHPGNISVGENNELIIYDRNFYLSLTDQEKTFVAQLVNIDALPIPTIREQLASIIHVPEGVSTEDVQRSLQGVAIGLKVKDTEMIQRKLIDVRKLGATIPLNINLLMKNLHTLNRFAKKAGFKDATEALLYTPPQTP